MSSHHTRQGIDHYQAPSAATSDHDESSEVTREGAGSAVEPRSLVGTVVPFAPEITIAKTQLENLIERIGRDTVMLKERMTGLEALEPRQSELERESEEASRRAEALGALAEGVREKLERLEDGHRELETGSADLGYLVKYFEVLESMGVLKIKRIA